MENINFEDLPSKALEELKVFYDYLMNKYKKMILQILMTYKKIKNPISFPEIEKRIRFLEKICYVSNLYIQDSYAAINIKNKCQ